MLIQVLFWYLNKNRRWNNKLLKNKCLKVISNISILYVLGEMFLFSREKNLFFFLIASLLVTEHEKELRDKYLKSGSNKIGKKFWFANIFLYQSPCFLICASKTLKYYQKSQPQLDYLLILLTIIFCLQFK